MYFICISNQFSPYEMLQNACVPFNGFLICQKVVPCKIPIMCVQTYLQGYTIQLYADLLDNKVLRRRKNANENLNSETCLNLSIMVEIFTKNSPIKFGASFIYFKGSLRKS